MQVESAMAAVFISLFLIFLTHCCPVCRTMQWIELGL